MFSYRDTRGCQQLINLDPFLVMAPPLVKIVKFGAEIRIFVPALLYILDMCHEKPRKTGLPWPRIDLFEHPLVSGHPTPFSPATGLPQEFCPRAPVYRWFLSQKCCILASYCCFHPRVAVYLSISSQRLCIFAIIVPERLYISEILTQIWFCLASQCGLGPLGWLAGGSELHRARAGARFYVRPTFVWQLHCISRDSR